MGQNEEKVGQVANFGPTSRTVPLKAGQLDSMHIFDIHEEVPCCSNGECLPLNIRHFLKFILCRIFMV